MFKLSITHEIIFFDEKFDFIIAEGVLHHISNIESCLLMLNGCLKDDGKMFVTEFEGPFRFHFPKGR